MGISTPTFRNLIERRREEMDPYRRFLRARYQPAFDRLFEHAYMYAPSAKLANDPDYGWLILFNMVLGNQREIRELKLRVSELEADAE